MMISKKDCMALLVKIEDETGINVNEYLKQIAISKEPPISVLKFIAEKRGIEVINFYEILRKSYNANKSPLYKNIVSEKWENFAVILSSLLTQIALHTTKLKDSFLIKDFLKQVRAQEITQVLNNLYNSESDEGASALVLLKLIRSDILVLEYITGRREKE